MTGSRGALILFFLSMPLMIRYLIKSKKVTWISFVCAIFLCAVFLANSDIVSKANQLSVYKRFNILGLNLGRSMIWQNSVDLIKNERLFFSGLGAGVLLYDTPVGSSDAHNSFLSLAITIGLMGSLLYLYILIRACNLKFLMDRKNLCRSFPGILALTSIVYMNTIGARIVRYEEFEGILLNINTSLEIILLWLIMGVSYIIRKERMLENLATNHENS